MYTINPKNETRIAWCLKYGIMLPVAPIIHIDGAWVTVCLFVLNDNPVIRICYSREELIRATSACSKSSTPCRWFHVPHHIVQPFMQGQEIR